MTLFLSINIQQSVNQLVCKLFSQMERNRTVRVMFYLLVGQWPQDNSDNHSSQSDNNQPNCLAVRQEHLQPMSEICVFEFGDEGGVRIRKMFDTGM